LARSVAAVFIPSSVLFYLFSGNFGGICGLFVGFSLISIVEFVYFFTLRLFFIVRNTKDENSKDNIDSRNKTTNRIQNNGNIYWREIMPRQVVSRY
jgi:amiloride-sensitive sodium channel